MPKSCEQISAITPIRTNQRRVRKNNDADESMKKKQKTNGQGGKDPRINEDRGLESQVVTCPDGCPDKTKVDMIKILLEMEDLNNSKDKNSSFISKLKNILHPEDESSSYGQSMKQENAIKEEPMNLDEETNPALSIGSNPTRTPRSKKTTKGTSNERPGLKPNHHKESGVQVFNCFFCSNKDGKNLSGYERVRYHFSLCLYDTGAYVPFLPHGQGQVGNVMDEIDGNGRQFKYKCPVEDCHKSLPKSKTMGYKEFSIHMGSNHGVLERWAKESDIDGAQELYHALKSWREEAGLTISENPNYDVEEVHTCLLCHGEGDRGKEGKELSFSPAKINSTRYHYASCLFDFGDGLYLEKYEPGPENLDKNGKLRDVLGKTVKYTCDMTCYGPSVRLSRKKHRPMGYKEFAIHMAHLHGDLEEILNNHNDERVRQIVPKIRN